MLATKRSKSAEASLSGLVALLAGILSMVVLVGCGGDDEPASVSTPNVSGTYEFVGEEAPNTMEGTITFEQEGDLVRVTGTEYVDNPSRELKGEGTIEGTRLDMVLVPINDDPTYEAEVLFIFSEDGDTFEVSFTDTNGDAGDMGSYAGVRQ